MVRNGFHGISSRQAMYRNLIFGMISMYPRTNQTNRGARLDTYIPLSTYILYSYMNVRGSKKPQMSAWNHITALSGILYLTP